VNFYNCVWLISNDIIVGTAFGAFLCEHNIVLARLLGHAVESALVSWVQRALLWLDSWPAGLKLNTELSQFYSYTFIDIVSMWGRVYFSFRRLHARHLTLLARSTPGRPDLSSKCPLCHWDIELSWDDHGDITLF